VAEQSRSYGYVPDSNCHLFHTAMFEG